MEKESKESAALKEVTHLQQELATAVVKMGKLDAQNQELREEVKRLKVEEGERRDQVTKQLRDELSRKNEALASLREEFREKKMTSERMTDRVSELNAALERERARNGAAAKERLLHYDYSHVASCMCYCYCARGVDTCLHTAIFYSTSTVHIPHCNMNVHAH